MGAFLTSCTLKIRTVLLKEIGTSSITLTSPNGGQYFRGAQPVSLTWTTSDLPAGTATIDLSYSLDNGGSWISIATGVSDTGSYPWTTPSVDSDLVLIKALLTDSKGLQSSDTSDAVAVIDKTLPALTLNSLTGGQIIGGNSSVPISWTSSDSHFGASPISIEVSSDGGANWSAEAGPLANSGSYSWTTPLVTSSTYRVRVTAVDRSGNSRTVASSSNFTINSTSPVITVTSPDGGQIWKGGSTHNITWTTSGLPAPAASATIKLEYTLDGTNWNTIVTGDPNDGTAPWTLPAADTATAKVRATVTDALAADTADVSDSDFTIDNTPPTLTLNQPNGGEFLSGGGTYSISWDAADTHLGANPITVEVSSNSGGAWTNVTNNVAHAGNPSTYTWNVPSVDSSTYRIRVTATDLAGNTQTATSAADFSIVKTAPTLASLTITNSAYTNNTTLGLTWGAASGGVFSQYCLQLNDTAVANCSWQTYSGSFPASIAGGTDGAKIAYAWLKGPTGLTSTMVTSNTVTLDTVRPTLTGVQVVNVSPTATRGYLLSYTGLSEAISQYCINENDTDVSHCSWITASALPDSFQVSTTQNAKVLSVWVRDLAGNTQLTRTDSNSVTYTNVLTISPTAATLTQTFSIESVEGQRGGMVTVTLASGKILMAGGCHADYSVPPYSTAKLYDPATDTWTSAGHMKFARCYPAFTLLADGRVLVAGGMTTLTTSTASAEIYDPTANKWIQTLPMGTSRAHAKATLLASGKVLISGGYTDTNSSANTRNTTELFDPAAGLWLTGPNMNSKRQDHEALRLANGTVLLIGGSTANNAATSTTDIFTASGHTGTIAAGPALSAARADFNAFLLGAAESPTGAESVIILGGYNGNTTCTNAVELYNGTAWATKNAITGNRKGAGAVKLADGTLLIQGGHDCSAYLSTTGVYNPLASSGAGTWTAKATYPAGVRHFSPQLLSTGRVFSVLGEAYYSDLFVGQTKIYNPTANTFDVTKHDVYPDLDSYAGPQLQLASGKIFTCSSKSEKPHCWLYDPVKAAFDNTADSAENRIGPMVVELADGRVMVMGGAYTALSNRRNTSTIYDPVANTWTARANLPRYVYAGQATALPGNRVLWVGGNGGTAFNHTSPLNTTAIYDVAGNSWTNPAGAVYPANVQYHRLVVTPTGRIFVSGGWNGSAALNTLNEWDDNTLTWTARASMTGIRNSHLMVYLPGGTDGKILVAGGYNDNVTTAIGTSEIYDIGTDTWSAAASLPSAITQGSICGSYVPSVGQVWFVGNWTGTAIARQVYRYNVAGNSWSTTFNSLSAPSSTINVAGGRVCGTLNDGRFWKGIGGEERALMEIFNIATPVKYTASNGDGDYTFSVTAGTGYIDNRNTFIPVVPLAPASSSTIRVDDGSGQFATGTASVP